MIRFKELNANRLTYKGWWEGFRFMGSLNGLVLAGMVSPKRWQGWSRQKGGGGRGGLAKGVAGEVSPNGQPEIPES